MRNFIALIHNKFMAGCKNCILGNLYKFGSRFAFYFIKTLQVKWEILFQNLNSSQLKCGFGEG